jgi:serine/threonine protein kinase
LKSIVAMKFLKPSSPGGTGALLERFGNEARLLAQLNHPNVVRVLDFEDNSTLPYVVMEFVDGSSASELLKQQGRLPLAKVLSILSQATRGLMAALHLGIIHRDVKPANILVDKLGIAKLVDLGLAVQMQSDDGTELGKGRGAEGTAGYMSPEQLQDGSSIDHRSDIYSLGVTFYHLLTGRLPFTGSNRNEVFFKHMTATPTAPHEICPDVPVEVSQIILKMMEKHPLDRPQTYEEVLALWDTVAGNAKELARSAK